MPGGIQGDQTRDLHISLAVTTVNMPPMKEPHPISWMSCKKSCSSEVINHGHMVIIKGMYYRVIPTDIKGPLFTIAGRIVDLWTSRKENHAIDALVGLPSYPILMKRNRQNVSKVHLFHCYMTIRCLSALILNCEWWQWSLWVKYGKWWDC